MATLSDIYNWFMTGKKPTQAQFWASWGSFRHKDEAIALNDIANLSTVLNAKAEKSQVDGHATDPLAHAELFERATLKNITELNNKVGIHNQNPEYILDVKNTSPVVNTLTGTFSFDGFMFTGVGTLMASELAVGDVIKVLSTGATYDIDFVIGNTEAYSFFGGGTLFSNEV
ncbi:hypothetical protein QT970_22185, partial [Microcoleus sp. herbarium8]